MVINIGLAMKVTSLFFSLSLSHLFLPSSVQGYSHTVYINASVLEDSPGCLTSNDPSSPCYNLTWVFLQDNLRNSTQYVLSEGVHFLTASSSFKDLVSLAFTGAESMVTCSGVNTGLSFVNVVDIVFYNVSFVNCAAIQNSTSKNFIDNVISPFQVGLYFYFCEAVNMSHVQVINSPHATGVVMYDTNGTNTISHSTFSNNSVTYLDKIYPGGGGFYVEFTYCEPGVLSCDTPTSERNSGATYVFTSCTFSGNRADNLDTEEYSTYIIPRRSDHEAFGRGGGLSVYFKGSASDNNFTVEDCIFQDNEALWGGGFFIEFQDRAYGNKIHAKDNIFIGNRCFYVIYHGTEGGGMRIGLYVYGFDEPIPQTASGNEITIENCNFSSNSALHGGGLSLSPSLQQVPQSQATLVHLLRNNFQDNVAKLGSAINIDRFENILKGIAPNVWIEECTFINNSVRYTQQIGEGNVPYQIGIGAVHVDEIPIWFKGETLFEGNEGSALSAIATVVNFTDCYALFSENRGDRGGAIALLGAAYMQISGTTKMVFNRNMARVLGGAIYNSIIGRENLKSDSNCFIRHINPFLHPDSWNATFLFVNNTDRAGSHQNAIHSTSILPCSIPGGSGVTNTTSHIFCWEGWSYNDHLVHCDADVTSDIGSLTYSSNGTVQEYPGWPFKMPIILEDDLQNPIERVSFTVTYNDTQNVEVYSEDSVLVMGEPNSAVEISVESLGNRVWHFDLIVEFKSCPPGFSPSNNSADQVECVCSGTFGGAVLCDDTSKKVQILNGMWIGKLDENEDEHFVMDCPLYFCKRSSLRYMEIKYNIEEDYLDIDLGAIICGGTNRTGINCGECIKGFGPAINSPIYQCINCTDINLPVNIAKYIGSVYLPLAVLFILLIVFDIRLTTGPANAFIVYAQLVTSTFDLNADGGIPRVSRTDTALNYVYHFCFGVFNLDFIENYIHPFCFSSSENFTTLTIFLLDYAVALFPLFMIILAIITLIISENCCLKNKYLGVQHRRRLLSMSRLASVLSRNKNKKINDALLPAFASFILLSYTKFSITSSYILNSQHPIASDGSQLDEERVYYASQYPVIWPYYRYVYVFPAVFIYVTIVVFTPLVLLDYPLKLAEKCISSVRCLKRIYPSSKIHLFLNMFQGCYRDNMRFFAGLYFFFRFVINLSYVVTDTWLQQFLVQQIATTVVIALLALCQPYEKKVLNYVDILIFTNLALLNSLSFYLFSIMKIDPKLTPPLAVLAIQYILILLPLVYMIGYLIWNVTRRYHTRIRLQCSRISKRMRQGWRNSDYEPLMSDSPDEDSPSLNITRRPRSFIDRQNEFEDDFDAMLSRAEDKNTYTPSLSKSVTVIDVSGKHSQGEANAFTTILTNDLDLHSSRTSRGNPPTPPDPTDDYEGSELLPTDGSIN